MNNDANTCIQRSLELADELMGLARSGVCCVDDDGCALLVGVVRDCAYKIRVLAEKERETHILRGCWQAESYKQGVGLVDQSRPEC